MRTLRIVLFGLGVIIVLFNDYFGKIEGFLEFLFIYFVSLAIAISHWLFKNIKFIINLKTEKAKTELMHLQSQVNPHFFFNMLNNLYGLIDRDSKMAKDLILKLSDMMRYSIYEGQKTYVTLGQEIDFIKNYIELNQMRYHKHVDIDFKVDVQQEDLKIMPLLFIILVENAFKHGVEVLRKDAYVHVQVSSKSNEVCLKIENNFDEEETGKGGIGLHNLKRRLDLVYPQKHVFNIKSDAGVYKAELTLSL